MGDRFLLSPINGVEPGFRDLAPRHGFEPRFTAPKAAVLPLDDRGARGGNTAQFSLTGRLHVSNRQVTSPHIACRRGLFYLTRFAHRRCPEGYCFRLSVCLP